MINLDEFIKKSKEVHGDKYDYSKVKFNKVTDKITIICPVHGEFEQVARQHYRGQGCPKCAIQNRIIKKSDTKESFIEKAKKIYGDKYDYSKVNYIDSLTKVTIICPVHGEFEKRPDGFLQGQGCPKCGREITSKKLAITQEEVISRLKKLYGCKYDYSKINYVNNHTPIKLICPIHGEFERTPFSLFKGFGCQKCNRIESAKKRTKTTEQFIEQAKLVHGDKYDYSNVKYINNNTPIEIICPKHGSFNQIPAYHLNGCGCSKCWNNSSHYENEIFDFIRSVYSGIVERDDRTILKSLKQSLDIFLPDKKIAFEFDGLYWHNEINKNGKNYHLNKTNICLNNNIQLIHIFEDEWLYKQEICKSRILNLLGLNKNKIGARNCEIKEINNSEYKNFVNKNHLQGYVPCKCCYGLYYNNELISIMSFGKLRKNLGSKPKENTYEMLRFCNKIGYSVIGGASKLLNYFIKTIKPSEIISYADRRWSNGDLYEKLGFKLDHISKPNYFYVFGDKRKNRFNYRKDILIKKFNCPEEMSEHEFCLSQHWYRIYDCGNKVYIWNK